MSDTASLPPAYQQATVTPFRDSRTYQSLPHGSSTIPRSSIFTKESKQGAVSLKLTGQRPSSTPVYGHGALIDGSVEVAKSDDIQSVELKIKGSLVIHEVGEEGSRSTPLFLHREVLWTHDGGPCPGSLHFNTVLPTSFEDKGNDYLLPPSYEAELPGVPGFHASVQFSVKATVIKGKVNSFAKAFGHRFGYNNPSVSTPFIYQPRTKPASSLPPPLLCSPSSRGFVDSLQWEHSEGAMAPEQFKGPSVVAKLYLPRSKTFCLRQPIPFHLSFTSAALSLAAFKPYGPMTEVIGNPTTTVSVVRRASCDVRKDFVHGPRTDIWKTETIGHGTFQHAGEGSDWTSFQGYINVAPDVSVCGFDAGQFFVRDYVVMSVVPSEPHKAPFRDVRIVVPIQLTTDPWVNSDGADASTPNDFPYSSDRKENFEASP